LITFVRLSPAFIVYSIDVYGTVSITAESVTTCAGADTAVSGACAIGAEVATCGAAAASTCLEIPVN
jgi:hypothetical protein